MSARSWLWLLAVGYLAACSGKLNVGKTGEQQGGAGSGSFAGNGSGSRAGQGAGGASSAAGASVGPAVTPAKIECLAAQPATGARCQTEGSACVYPVPDTDAQQCVCLEAAAGDLRWSCDYAPFSDPSCPAQMPVVGADCFGHFGTSCGYPINIACNCSPTPGTWQCAGPRRPDFPEPPTALPPSAPIKQLSAAQRSALCQWQADALYGPGFPPQPDAAVDANGRAASSCFLSHGAACQVAMTSLSPAQCAQNLALSTCAAPVSDLIDCVTTALNQCVPSPHGCPRFLQSPGCDGTMVTSFAQTASAGTSSTGGIDGGGVPGSGGLGNGCAVRVQ